MLAAVEGQAAWSRGFSRGASAMLDRLDEAWRLRKCVPTTCTRSVGPPS
jgi:hypothetical protein